MSCLKLFWKILVHYSNESVFRVLECRSERERERRRRKLESNCVVELEGTEYPKMTGELRSENNTLRLRERILYRADGCRVYIVDIISRRVM